MELTDTLKADIDSMSYQELLHAVRYDPIGSERFQGESGDYILQRLVQLRDAPGGPERHVAASKAIGW